MNEKKRMIFGAFAVTLILLLLCAGFVAVDLSSGKYMPGQFGAFFEITSVTPDGVSLTVLSNDYHFPFYSGGMDKDLLVRLRSALPALPFAVGSAAAQAVEYFLEGYHPKS